MMFVLLLVRVVLVNGESMENMVSSEAVATAVTLIGSVSFIMSLYYLTNHRDADIRRYTYTVVCETIAIFCAVLLFNSINDAVQSLLLENAGIWLQILVATVHFFVWYVSLQVSLAWLSGSVGSFVDVEMFETADNLTKHDIIEKVENNMKCFAVLLAHISGFASVHLWSTIQQAPFMGKSAPMMFLAVPLALVAQFILQRITNEVRYWILMADGVETIFEREWDVQTAAAEDNVMGLTLSFTFTAALRTTMSGVRPNLEGMDPLDKLIAVGAKNAGMLMLASSVFITLAFVGCIYLPSFITAEEDDMEDMLLLCDTNDDDQRTGQIMEAQKRKEKHRFYNDLIMRTARTTIVTMCMGFAWCQFFSTRWLLAGLNVCMINLKNGTTIPDLEILSVVTALTLSFGAVVLVFVLDKLADADWTGDEVDKAIFQVISAIGILVGVAWDQCFMQSVSAVASQSSNPHICKFVLAVMSASLVAPAWKWYLLPMAHHMGWRYGFIPSVKKLRDVSAHIKDKANNSDRFVVAAPAQANESSTKSEGGNLWEIGDWVTPEVNCYKPPELEVTLAENNSLKIELCKVQAEYSFYTKLYSELAATMSETVKLMQS